MSSLRKQVNQLNNGSCHGFHVVGEGTLKELNAYYATDPEPDPMKGKNVQKQNTQSTQQTARVVQIDPPFKTKPNAKPRIDTDSVVRTDKKQSRRVPSPTGSHF